MTSADASDLRSEQPTEARALGSSYTIIAVIGRGSTGEVWRGEITETREPIAAKLLFESLTRDTDLVARFIRERSLLTRVEDPHVVRVRDLVVEGDTLAVITDLVDGPSLREVIGRNGTVRPLFAIELCQQVLRGLAAVHQCELIHRDVKPENVLIERSPDGDAVARIVDFGIAQLAHADSSPMSTEIVGSMEYIAPELLEGNAASPLSDIYSVGIVLYELLCGRTPFASELPVTVMRRQINEPPVRPDGVPDATWEVMSRLIAKTPESRPRSAGEAASLLGQALPSVASLPALPVAVDVVPASQDPNDETIITTRKPKEVGAQRQHAKEPRRRHTALVVGAVATVVAVAAAATALIWTNQDAAAAMVTSATEHYTAPSTFSVDRTLTERDGNLNVDLTVNDAPKGQGFNLVEYLPASFTKAGAAAIRAAGATASASGDRVQLSVPAGDQKVRHISYLVPLADTGDSRGVLDRYERARVRLLTRATGTGSPDALTDLAQPPAIAFDAGQLAWLHLSGVTARSGAYVTQSSTDQGPWLNALKWQSTDSHVASVERTTTGAPVINGNATGHARLTTSLAGRTFAIDIDITPATQAGPRCEPGVSPGTRVAVEMVGGQPRIAEGTLFERDGSNYVVSDATASTIHTDRICNGASVVHRLTGAGLLPLVSVVG